MARPVVVRVVGRRTVRDMRETELALDGLQRSEELLLAVKAAVRVVAPVCGELNLAGLNLDQATSQPRGQRACLFLLRLGIGGRARQHRDRTFPELVQCELQKQRGINTP